jgi:hypothetical protein
MDTIEYLQLLVSLLVRQIPLLLVASFGLRFAFVRRAQQCSTSRGRCR